MEECKYYYYIDKVTGVLISTIYDYPSNIKSRLGIDLIEVTPPEIPFGHTLKWSNNLWELIETQLTPTLNKLTILADGLDAVKITDLPAECTIVFDNISYICTDTECEITVDMSGEYSLVIEANQRYSFITTIIAI